MRPTIRPTDDPPVRKLRRRPGLVILGSKLRDKLGIISPLHLRACLPRSRAFFTTRQGKEGKYFRVSLPSLTTFVFAETGRREREQKPRPSVVLQSQLQLASSVVTCCRWIPRAIVSTYNTAPIPSPSASLPPWQTREQALKITISATADRPSERAIRTWGIRSTTP